MPRREKLEYLFELAEVQQRASQLFFGANVIQRNGAIEEAARAFAEAEKLQREVLALTEQHNADYPDTPMTVASDANTLINTMTMRADVVDTLGDSALADALRSEAMELARRYLSPEEAARHRRARAAALAADGRYHEAISELLDAQAVLAKAGDSEGLAQVGAQLAETYEWLGDIARARDAAAAASALLTPTLSAGEPSMEDILGALLSGKLEGAVSAASQLQAWLALTQLEGRLCRQLGDHARARAAFERALERAPGAGRPGIAFQLARIDIQSGEHERGYELLCALEPQFIGAYVPKLGVLKSWKAEALLRMQRFDEALALAREGAEALAQQEDLDSAWQAQWRVARCCLAAAKAGTAQRSRRHALEWARRAIATIGTLRRAPLGHRLDSTFLADKLVVFDTAIRLAVELDEPVIACALIDAIKSRALTAILRTPSGPGATEDKHLDELTRELARVEHQLRVARSEPLERRRSELLASRANAIEEIRIRDPRWRVVSESRELDVPALQASLAVDGASALSLYWNDEDLVAVLVTPTGCRAAAHTPSAAAVAAVRRYRDSLHGSKWQVGLFDPARFDLAAAALVPETILEAALLAKSLVIVPHGELHVLPWAVMKHRERRLFEHTPITIAPSLSSFTLLRGRRTGSVGVGLIGGPEYPDEMKVRGLELAHTELAQVMSHYRMRGARVLDAIEGADARCDAFVALATRGDAQGGVLHVICHGDFETGEPLRSGLLFSDGKVDAAAIARMSIKYDEVVLSACSTGYRPTVVQDVALSGDDIVGLVAAFIEAGASSVLVSIPPAREDAGQRFMSAYHKERAAGAPAASAFRAAQRTLLEEGRYELPLWAGYTLYGG